MGLELHKIDGEIKELEDQIKKTNEENEENDRQIEKKRKESEENSTQKRGTNKEIKPSKKKKKTISLQETKLKSLSEKKKKLEALCQSEKFFSFTLDLAETGKLRRKNDTLKLVFDQKSTESAESQYNNISKIKKTKGEKIPLIECFDGEKAISYDKRNKMLKERLVDKNPSRKLTRRASAFF
ncbi:MAG: hypothetical protein LBP39_03220 [Rickettsiales bacterium]|jgi:chromosome segregation ATPase|nr:hypothetical protein [Rickettsiales bacterium]